MEKMILILASTFLFGVLARAEIDPHARVCVLAFTQSQSSTTTTYSCDGAKEQKLINEGKTMSEIQSHALKLFMDKMLIPKSCAAVNTTEDKEKVYQLTCILHP